MIVSHVGDARSIWLSSHYQLDARQQLDNFLQLVNPAHWPATVTAAQLQAPMVKLGKTKRAGTAVIARAFVHGVQRWVRAEVVRVIRARQDKTRFILQAIDYGVEFSLLAGLIASSIRPIKQCALLQSAAVPRCAVRVKLRDLCTAPPTRAEGTRTTRILKDLLPAGCLVSVPFDKDCPNGKEQPFRVNDLERLDGSFAKMSIKTIYNMIYNRETVGRPLPTLPQYSSGVRGEQRQYEQTEVSWFESPLEIYVQTDEMIRAAAAIDHQANKFYYVNTEYDTGRTVSYARAVRYGWTADCHDLAGRWPDADPRGTDARYSGNDCFYRLKLAAVNRPDDDLKNMRVKLRYMDCGMCTDWVPIGGPYDRMKLTLLNKHFASEPAQCVRIVPAGLAGRRWWADATADGDASVARLLKRVSAALRTGGVANEMRLRVRLVQRFEDVHAEQLDTFAHRIGYPTAQPTLRPPFYYAAEIFDEAGYRMDEKLLSEFMRDVMHIPLEKTADEESEVFYDAAEELA